VRRQLVGGIESGTSSDTAHHAPRLRLAHPLTGRGDEQRPIRPAAEVVIERSHNRRRQHGPILFAALADDAQDPVPPVVAQVLEGQPDQ
jgi:hypothetical protein